MPSATIKLFLVHGDAKRLRTAELSNWTGKAIAGPRSELEGVLAREEAEKSGVYFLTGTDPGSGRPTVYVGEAESVRDRLRGHLDKDFWNHVVFFVSKGEDLTKAHIRYLEGRLIEQARSAGRALVMNGQASGSKLPESDREDMEIFLERVHQLMPVLGADALLPIGSTAGGRVGVQTLICETKGLRATGLLTPEGLVVLKGSQAVLKERPSARQWPNTVATRRRLIDEGVLVEDGEHLTFARDVEFSSPSAAATVVQGGSANGLLAWKTKVVPPTVFWHGRLRKGRRSKRSKPGKERPQRRAAAAAEDEPTADADRPRDRRPRLRALRPHRRRHPHR